MLLPLGSAIIIVNFVIVILAVVKRVEFSLPPRDRVAWSFSVVWLHFHLLFGWADSSAPSGWSVMDLPAIGDAFTV